MRVRQDEGEVKDDAGDEEGCSEADVGACARVEGAEAKEERRGLHECCKGEDACEPIAHGVFSDEDVECVVYPAADEVHLLAVVDRAESEVAGIEVVEDKYRKKWEETHATR